MKKRYSLADHSAEKVQAARETVANFWAEKAREIRQEDPYAPHVTEQEKDECLQKSLTFSERIRNGKEDHCFFVWQRMIVELTGECPALLP